MKNLLYTSILLFLLVCAAGIAKAQTTSGTHFRVTSPVDKGDRNYGTVTIAADTKTVLIESILANGENVKALTIRINNGFAYKLAPSTGNNVLNYVGTGLNIALQPGDKAVIEFIPSANVAARQLYVSAATIN